MEEVSKSQETVNKPYVGSNFADGFLGLFVVLAAAGLLVMWMWLKNDSIFEAPQRFKLVFHDVVGLNANAAVNCNGVRVGTVESIELEGKSRVVVGVKINKQKLTVVSGSKFDILSVGAIGAKYIDVILPDSNTANSGIALNEKSLVNGEESVKIESVVNKLVADLGKLDLHQDELALRHNLEKFGQTADGMSSLTKKMTPAADNLNVLSKKMQPVADNINILSKKMQPVADRTAQTLDSVDATTKQMSQILDKRHPLMHMVFGRPGHIKDKDKNKNKVTEQAPKMPVH